MRASAPLPLPSSTCIYTPNDTAYTNTNEETERHARALQDNRLAFRGFNVGDLVLFIRVTLPSGSSFLAFNDECPHHYLSPASIGAVGHSAAYTLGRIVFLERKIAHVDTKTCQEDACKNAENGTALRAKSSTPPAVSTQSTVEICSSENPYGLPPNTRYCELTVEPFPPHTSTTPVTDESSVLNHDDPRAEPRISFHSFHVGQVALFFHTGIAGCYLAFNQNCGHHYLAPESIASAQEQCRTSVRSNGDTATDHLQGANDISSRECKGNADGWINSKHSSFSSSPSPSSSPLSSSPPSPASTSSPAYVFGEIVFMDHRIATAKGDLTGNPFNLQEGTVFYMVTIAPMGMAATG